MPRANIYGDLRHRCKDEPHYKRACRMIRRGMGIEEALNHTKNMGDGLSRTERKKSVYVQCENCGKTICKAPWQIANSKHYFCSQSCAHDYKKAIIPQISDRKFQEIYNYCRPYLRGIYYRVCRKYRAGGLVTYAEFEQEVIICIYKYAKKNFTNEEGKRIFWCKNLNWAFARYITSHIFRKDAYTYLLPFENDTTPYEICRTREMARFLDNADDYKLLLKWSFENVSTEDLCREAGCNAHALGIRLSRARARLAEELNMY